MEHCLLCGVPMASHDNAACAAKMAAWRPTGLRSASLLLSPPHARTRSRKRRLHFGRLQVYLEPRDLWIGVYVARDALYLCLLPVLVFRWTRRGAG